MALLLNIDTATNYGAVAVSYNGKIISVIENYHQREHATFLHTAVSEVLLNCGNRISDIDAIGVVIGPGSYTGLRVGLSAAKGLCYAAGKPLIGVNTLQAIALAASAEQLQASKPVLFIPMIDARRMEVFTATYDIYNQLNSAPMAVVVDEHFMKEFWEEFFLIFAGDGSKKLPELPLGNFMISSMEYNMQQVVHISESQFNNGLFEDIAYSEPFYLKPFYSTAFVKK